MKNLKCSVPWSSLSMPVGDSKQVLTVVKVKAMGRTVIIYSALMRQAVAYALFLQYLIINTVLKREGYY